MKLSHQEGGASRQVRRQIGAALRNIGAIKGGGIGLDFSRCFDQAVDAAFVEWAQCRNRPGTYRAGQGGTREDRGGATPAIPAARQWRGWLLGLVEAYASRDRRLNPDSLETSDMLRGFHIYSPPYDITETCLDVAAQDGQVCLSWQGDWLLERAGTPAGPWKDTSRPSPAERWAVEAFDDSLPSVAGDFEDAVKAMWREVRMRAGGR